MNEIKIGKYLRITGRINSSLFLLIVLCIIFLMQCVTPFDPEITESADLINIDGSLIKGQEIQTVVVSRSTSLQEKTFYPVGGCSVYVIDKNSNRFDFSPGEKGFYTASIDDAFLNYDNSYQLYVITALGETYVSTFETIYENQAIDSVYSISEKQFSIRKGKEFEGIQFYLDLKGSESTSRFYKWSIDESWEHHAKYYIHFFYPILDENLYRFPDIDSLYYCYDHASVAGFYVSNTLNLEKNEKKKIPLHFVNSPSLKLSVKYSCLVHQYSLGEGAFEYWNQKKIDLMESGGLYTTQPSQAISNIHNINNPDEIVLGYFWASAKTEKRFFYPYHISYDYDECELDSFFYSDYTNSPDTLYYRTNPDTIYIYQVPEDWIYTTSKNCFDCRFQGGTLIKPDYWDDN